MQRIYTFLATVLVAVGCTKAEDSAKGSGSDRVVVGRIDPHRWPKVEGAPDRDKVIEERVAEWLAKMSLEELVGQVIQADIGSVSPGDVRKYHLGSILNGGNSAPGGEVRSHPSKWLALADAYWEANMKSDAEHLGIPLIWGTDAVHGHNNIVGATIFPHNIGLGAAGNPELMEQIGQVTAKEIRATGMEWTFAPTLAVVRDDRWGRTYESWSEDPKIVATYAEAFVRGLQGQPGTPDFLGSDRVLATAKHFLGDGGTKGGVDQGDNQSSEEELRDIHAAGYYAAINNGVQTVMASFSSYHGIKLHGYRELLNDILVERMGFDGFLVGDWDGHAQVAGCSPTSCAAAFNAGLDMFMAPESWKGLYHSLLNQVKDGTISRSRLEEAVTRILRVKGRLGLFSAQRPSMRPGAGDWSVLSNPEHKAVARRAVRSSLVLLKNNNKILPIAPNQTVMVTGEFADDIAMLCGGWTLSWQGGGNTNEHFPHGESVYSGIKTAIEAGGGNVFLSSDGSYAEKPDVAVVVFGEQPYAEYRGDRTDVDYEPERAHQLLQKLQAEGVRTISIFVSGRPMWVNPEINASDAFVAAWLPGDQGGGIADVIISKPDGSVNYDFKGKLSFSWPFESSGHPINIGDENYRPQFAFGYGLTYKSEKFIALLPEATNAQNISEPMHIPLIEAKRSVDDWTWILEDEEGEIRLGEARGKSASGSIHVRATDDQAQEDTLTIVWDKWGGLRVQANALDLGTAYEEGYRLSLRYRVRGSVVKETTLSMQCANKSCGPAMDMTPLWENVHNAGWQEVSVPLTCLIPSREAASEVTSPLWIQSKASFELDLSWVRLTTKDSIPNEQLPLNCLFR